MDAGVQILEPAQNAQLLFEHQARRQKRRLLNFALSNCSWVGGEVVATFRQPFDLLAELTAIGAGRGARNMTKLAKGENWLSGPDQTANFALPITVERSPRLLKRRKRDRDREERIRLAVGSKPSLREKAYAFAREQTTVRTCDFTAIGIPRHNLAWMCEDGVLVKVGYCV
jgi:hypothetical protein